MRFMVALPTDHVEQADELLTGDGIAACARAAEEAGFDACFVTDHPAPDARWLAAGGHHALDPFVALSFAAAATTRIRVQTHILVIPYRNPLLTAKSLLSLDLLSRGRVTLGVASGYLKPEFAALGVDFDERNELTDEAIDVIAGVLSSDTPEGFVHEGRHFRSRGTVMRPPPVQRPHPPIWVGGNSKIAIRRAVDRAQGWVPFPNPGGPGMRAVRTPEMSTLEHLADRLAFLRDYADDVGRRAPLDVCFSPLTRRPSFADLDRLAAMGVTWCVLGTGTVRTRTEYADAVRRLADEVILPFRERAR